MSLGKKENYWISLSDLMTVLMMIFLFISISYMIDVNAKKIEREKIFEEYKTSKIDLYNELEKEFSLDFSQNKWDVILDKNLSIKFVNETVLFDHNKSDLKPGFKTILKDFFPRYLRIILNEKYKNKIAEVRIEGHTDVLGDYIYNLELSQNRTRNVMKYLFDLSYYQKLSSVEKEKLRFWLTANGLSFGKTLDKDGNLSYNSKKSVDNDKCRRVEFRIITTSEQLVEEAIRQIGE
jgi:outer membrane protein OmpA-like peptidoglycan-associated protein